ncbi:MAG: LLM class flavin-dependent oxidoreductase [Candidatus Thorarchaeota archaeon]|jgi:alkanesulfonate monooxygenase SsuD/methylene tetrahydromethanopterin reductase-like flavin-dependent oxidoreductase (luciferase family)
MAEEMRFGIVVLQNMPWKELVKLWQKFDTLNFDSTWIADHFVNYANPTDPWFEGWTTLAALAGCTSRIRVGTLVTSISLRNPALLARQAMTVDHISNGRLELGIGAGAPGSIDPSYQMIGMGNWSFQERSERLREQVEIVDKLLRNITASYSGEYYEIDKAIIAPGPLQKPRPPLIVAAHAKTSLKVAAEYADTWVSFGGDFGAPVEVVVEKTSMRNETLNKYCEKLGRNPATIRRSLLIFGAEGNTAFASEDHFIEIVERYAAIGINELIFFYPFFAPDQIPIFEKIAEETIPKLRGS